RFGLLLAKAITFLQRLEFQFIDSIQHPVKFLMEALVGAQLRRAFHQHVERPIKLLLGGLKVSGFVVVLPSLIFAFYLADDLSDRIRLRGWLNLRRRRNR